MTYISPEKGNCSPWEKVTEERRIRQKLILHLALLLRTYKMIPLLFLIKFRISCSPLPYVQQFLFWEGTDVENEFSDLQDQKKIILMLSSIKFFLPPSFPNATIFIFGWNLCKKQVQQPWKPTGKAIYHNIEVNFRDGTPVKGFCAPFYKRKHAPALNSFEFILRCTITGAFHSNRPKERFFFEMFRFQNFTKFYDFRILSNFKRSFSKCYGRFWNLLKFARLLLTCKETFLKSS